LKEVFLLNKTGILQYFYNLNELYRTSELFLIISVENSFVA